MVLIDTNILIEIIRHNANIIEKCDALGVDNLAISSISYVEFLVGSRDKQDLYRNMKFLNKFRQIAVDENINDTLISIFENYSLSHRPSIPDMLIAATAIYYKTPLYTLNSKDFIYLADLTLI
ncbi:type II toxin-antitoxin system VapC family toxin [uncultured Mucilaginibacter sp.]|uniref:type II toxin-antitoxin system VapC family toxin n=1 Tax=uncultured Mucilaginibacter sp. TaxID=797541 RepID=UPI0025E19940|nr:type II toxin-antitoxin system VapC family toxin [uncultured Mucilaginibacter sp.]